MADTNWQDFPDSAPQAADIFLAMRGAGGVNSTMAQIAAFAAANGGDGAVGTPGFSFASDPDTGFFRPGANVLAAAIGGAEGWRLTSTGLGVGVTPAYKLDVSGANDVARLVSSTTYAGVLLTDSTGTMRIGSRSGGYIVDIGGVERIRIATSGNVGIGVSGDAAEAFHVARPGWCLQQMQNSAGIMKMGVISGSGHAVIEATTAGKNLLFNMAGVTKMACDGSQFYPGADNDLNLGYTTNRWKQLYAVTNVISTSDEREKLWVAVMEDRRAKDRRIARAIMDELGWFQFLSAVDEKGEDGARWHFGARAQRVWTIVAAEGLCAPLVGTGADQQPDPGWGGPVPPAWLCWDEWPDRYEPIIEEQQIDTRTVVVGQEPTGILDAQGRPVLRDVTEELPVMGMVEVGQKLVQTAGNRFGLRVDQLGLLLDWALHERLCALEVA